MKYIYCLLLFIGFSCTSFKPLQNQQPSSNKFIAADGSKNIYVIGVNNTITKYQDHAIKFSQNFKTYGNIASIDCSNSMELYIFYKEANQMVFLDNTLSFRGLMDLSKTNIGLATAVCRSYDNGLWVFDQTDLQVKKLNKSGEILQSSGNPIMITSGQLNPTYMTEDGNLLYMSDTSIGIIITDLNAIYQKTIPLKGIKQFTVHENKLYFLESTLIYELDLKSYTKKVVHTLLTAPMPANFVSHSFIALADQDSSFRLVNFSFH